MIRFMPDSWMDVVMRPLDMAAPEANSYVEIAAPDVRFAAAVLLAATVLLLWRRRSASAREVLWLLALLLLSTGIWLTTTGNGRYFMAWLVLLGPLCIGLIRLLPSTAAAKLSLGAGLIAVQVFVLTQNPPWGTWTWASWGDPPYFGIETPPAEPATYVTIANISYSLVAPQFPAQSRWIGLGGGIAKRDATRVEKLLATSPRLTLIAPAIPSETLVDGRPSAPAADAIGRLLRPHGLLLSSPEQCRYLASAGLMQIAQRQESKAASDPPRKLGFWLCPLEYRQRPPTAPDEDYPAVNAVFEAVERLCPRFFAAGDPMRIQGGWVKHYDSDTKVYLLDDGTAYYKFWRSLNPVEIGTTEQLRAGRATLDCTKIRAPNWRRGGP